MKKIVVIGSSNMDLVVSTPQFPRPGETVMGSDFMMNLGGKGANQAVAATRLGGNVSFIAKVGEDAYGREMKEQFAAEGMNIDHVTATDCSSGIAVITVNSDGENNIVVVGGANQRLTGDDIDNARGLIEASDIVLMQLETPVETLTRAAAMAHSMGKLVVLNPAPARTLPVELLENVDIIIPNETEASLLSGIEVTDNDSAAKAIAKLQSLGVKDVIMTMGSQGAATTEGGKLVMVPTPRVTAVDTTAAGDTFCGAFCVALGEDMDKKDAIAFACKAAAYTVQHRGAQCAMPRREQIK
ncbi:MAG: ribokinase [Bacteroidales bacterium]|nr:ribokinase [Candidatus Sodaliphilus aphodohippi]